MSFTFHVPVEWQHNAEQNGQIQLRGMGLTE